MACGGSGDFIAEGPYLAIEYPGRAGRGFDTWYTAALVSVEVRAGMRHDIPDLRESLTKVWLRYRWTEVSLRWSAARQVHENPIHFSSN